MLLDRLEQLPLGRFQYKLLAVTGLGWLFDAMDTGLIAFVLPVLAREWGLTPAQAGWIGSMGLIGCGPYWAQAGVHHYRASLQYINGIVCCGVEL